MRNIREKSICVSASVSCMDLCHLSDAMEKTERAGISFYHFDVVDGRFNHCFILGEATLEKMRSETQLPIEVHLAAYQPEKYIEGFAKAGADYISVHYEAMKNPLQIFDLIRRYGCEPVLSYRCTTPPGKDFVDLAKEVPMVLKLTVEPGYAGQTMKPESVDHIRQMRRMLEKSGIYTPIQADGNINLNTIPFVTSAGATILTGGTSGLFRKGMDVHENLHAMINAAKII